MQLVEKEENMKKNDVLLKPVEKDSLYLKISDAVYSYIKMNNLQPDDKLPSERDMAAMLQTSRNSVREGLRILEDRGLIYVKTGSGVFVKDPYGEHSAISVRLSECTTEELQELQTILDHQAVLNAISRGTREEKEKLVSIASELMEKYSKNIYSHTLDYSFHTELYEMGRNKAVHQVIQGIRDRRFVQRENADGENDSVWLATIPQHFQLAEAIFNSNSAAALAAVDEILEHGFSLLDHSRQK